MASMHGPSSVSDWIRRGSGARSSLEAVTRSSALDEGDPCELAGVEVLDGEGDDALERGLHVVVGGEDAGDVAEHLARCTTSAATRRLANRPRRGRDRESASHARRSAARRRRPSRW
jgi:hypothetical protein